MSNAESVIIVLPLPVQVLQPNCTIGSFGGRMLKASAIKRYRALACLAVENECVETMPWEKVAVQAEFFHKDKRKRDEDNSMGSLKAAYDGIVDSGLVEDDDYEHMQRSSPVFSVDKKHPRVELTITRGHR